MAKTKQNYFFMHKERPSDVFIWMVEGVGTSDALTMAAYMAIRGRQDITLEDVRLEYKDIPDSFWRVDKGRFDRYWAEWEADLADQLVFSAKAAESGQKGGLAKAENARKAKAEQATPSEVQTNLEDLPEDVKAVYRMFLAWNCRNITKSDITRISELLDSEDASEEDFEASTLAQTEACGGNDAYYPSVKQFLDQRRFQCETAKDIMGVASCFKKAKKEGIDLSQTKPSGPAAAATDWPKMSTVRFDDDDL